MVKSQENHLEHISLHILGQFMIGKYNYNNNSVTYYTEDKSVENYTPFITSTHRVRPRASRRNVHLNINRIFKSDSIRESTSWMMKFAGARRWRLPTFAGNCRQKKKTDCGQKKALDVAWCILCVTVIPRVRRASSAEICHPPARGAARARRHLRRLVSCFHGNLTRFRTMTTLLADDTRDILHMCETQEVGKARRPALFQTVSWLPLRRARVGVFVGWNLWQWLFSHGETRRDTRMTYKLVITWPVAGHELHTVDTVSVT